MCSDVAISVKNLTKTYRTFGHPGDRIKQAFTLGRVKFHREFTAIRDVSFEIQHGETIGIVGRNGSGKSTLLQLICGILKPTSGSVQMNGRVSALLELGAGFNPEFTGRENVYFQGTLMGLTEAEIDARYGEILAFADIGEFIDQPVRTYSSGMFVRLAFAAAISIEPEILIVDEALAVGDEKFQSKCFAYIRAARESGRTVVFVSHSSPVVADLCTRVMLIDEGLLVVEGRASDVLAKYQELIFATPARAEYLRNLWIHKTSEESTIQPEKLLSYIDPNKLSPHIGTPQLEACISYESRGVLIADSRIETTDGVRVSLLVPGQAYNYRYRIEFYQDVTNVRYGMLVKNLSGYELGGLVSHPAGSGICNVSNGAVLEITLPFRCVFITGAYLINAGVFGRVGQEETYLHRIVDASFFRVAEISDRLQTGIVDVAS